MNGRSRRNEIAIQVKVPWTNEETKLSGKQSKKPEFAHSTGEVGEFEPEEAPAEGQIKDPYWGHTRDVYKTNLHGRSVNEAKKNSEYCGSLLSESLI